VLVVGEILLAIMLTAGQYDTPPNCKIMYQGAQDEWRFVRVYEVASGKVILQTVIRGGASRDVHVATPGIRVDSKWAGDIDYKPGPTVQCANGGTVTF
jgi:hypothetical protein